MKNEIILSSSLPTESKRGNIVEVIRKDGLKVFLDGDIELDNIRKRGSKKEVIMAVALRRAQQIVRNYASKYAPELINDFNITRLIEND